MNQLGRKDSIFPLDRDPDNIMFHALIQPIDNASNWYKALLVEYHKKHPFFEKEVTIQLLSIHLHLLENIQRHFLICASHPDLAHRRALRKTLVDFANEEEHFAELIHKDLKELKATPLPAPFEVELWWAYFDKQVYTHPFLRIGAALIYENLPEKAKDTISRLTHAPYLNPNNTHFFSALHRNHALSHGAELLASLQGARLENHHIDQLKEGATKGFFLLEKIIQKAFQEQNSDVVKKAA